ncbi:MAG: DUF2892 domain-containing protein [Propionibacteriaceae bacterium]|nr:DUF2892 domain-containing protein [Micropruina sp.]HBX79775.1 DUF2892 domain-containing protein [Propionibacteriaceae bacterium]HBY22228.1 DUF2892 domain-containing protein [Propionibacteriaceae bacterium]
MKANESTTDRIIRGVVGVLLIVLYFANVITGWLGIVLAVVGAVLVVTGAVGFCPLYRLFGISTCKVRKA